MILGFIEAWGTFKENTFNTQIKFKFKTNVNDVTLNNEVAVMLPIARKFAATLQGESQTKWPLPSSVVFPILISVLSPFRIHEIVNALLCTLLKHSLLSALFLLASQYLIENEHFLI